MYIFRFEIISHTSSWSPCKIYVLAINIVCVFSQREDDVKDLQEEITDLSKKVDKLGKDDKNDKDNGDNDRDKSR